MSKAEKLCVKRKEAYAPPFSITEEILNLVADISSAVGRLDAFAAAPMDVQLRKDNRIKSIHSSIAIENNSLTLEQVTDIINGKRVRGPAKDIREAKNAFAAYAALADYRPFVVSDFLLAHALLMKGLLKSAGGFRMQPVGVFAGAVPIFIAPPPELVQGHVRNLFKWAARSTVHPLVKSSVMHYEIEFIHPFADGNGRIGRLWQTVVLSRWNGLFAWLPVETMVHRRQQAYYAALRESNAAGSATPFITFMLNAIREALDAAGKKGTEKVAEKVTENQRRILAEIKGNPQVTSETLSARLGISAAKIRVNLTKLKTLGLLRRIGPDKGGHWEVLK